MTDVEDDVDVDEATRAVVSQTLARYRGLAVVVAAFAVVLIVAPTRSPRVPVFAATVATTSPPISALAPLTASTVSTTSTALPWVTTSVPGLPQEASTTTTVPSTTTVVPTTSTSTSSPSTTTTSSPSTTTTTAPSAACQLLEVGC